MIGVRFAVSEARLSEQRKAQLEQEMAQDLQSIRFLGIYCDWVPCQLLRIPPPNLVYLSVEEVLTPPISSWGWNNLSQLQHLRIRLHRGLERRGDMYRKISAFLKVSEEYCCTSELLSFIAKCCPELESLQISLHESRWNRNDSIYPSSLWSGECPFKHLKYLHIIGSFLRIVSLNRCCILLPPTMKALALTDANFLMRSCPETCDHMSTLLDEATTLHVGSADHYAPSNDWHQMLSVAIVP